MMWFFSPPGPQGTSSTAGPEMGLLAGTECAGWHQWASQSPAKGDSPQVLGLFEQSLRGSGVLSLLAPGHVISWMLSMVLVNV